MFMKKSIQFLIILIIAIISFKNSAVAECTAKDTDISDYSENKEMDLHVDTRHFTLGEWNHYIRIPIPPISRGCVTGPLLLHFQNWDISGVDVKTILDNSIKDIHIKLKVLKISKTCKLDDSDSSKCETVPALYPTEGFIDEAEFVSWEPKYAGLFKQGVKDQAERVKEDEDRKIRNEKYEAEQASAPERCKPFYAKVNALKKKFAKTIPDLQKKYMESGMAGRLDTTEGERIKTQQDENTFLNRETVKFQKEMAKLVMSKEGQKCPSEDDSN